MDNGIVIDSAGYLAVLIAVVVAFGYALFHVLGLTPEKVRRYPCRASAAARADAVADDRC
jgi:hypothetical protein